MQSRVGDTNIVCILADVELIYCANKPLCRWSLLRQTQTTSQTRACMLLLA